MSKVKIIIRKGYGEQGIPVVDGSEEVIDICSVPDTHDIIGVIRTDFGSDQSGEIRVSDAINPVIRYERINGLTGKLLTILDAANSNDALKLLVKKACWDWYEAQSGQLTEPWRLDKFPKYKEAFNK